MLGNPLSDVVLLYTIRGNTMRVKKKILPEYFEAVLSGHKNFELRKDEDNFQVGDFIVLLEWDPSQNNYTGRFTSRKVKCVLRNVPEFGLQEGHCIIGW